MENMDIDDYTTSLGPKVAGTANLNLFFASQNLDFFITLSSVSAILGKSGQANYAVGNSFQDAFCRANSDRQREVGGSTRYVSLNLGAIDGSEAITSLPIRQQELMRQGAVLMSFDELFRVLEYSMNSDENAPGSGQMLMGFDRESMTNIQDQQALSNPLFSMVPYTATDFDDNNGPGAKFDPLTEIKKCKSADEAADIIARTMLEKVASFLGLPIEDLSVHTPMKDYALDSLVSIELKNSICRTFQISMQVQDLGNPLGLAGIATGIVDKLKLFHGESGSRQKDTSTPGEEATPVTQEDHMKKHGQRCCKNAPTLARYPLPDLAEEFRMHLESIPHFASDTAELENHQAAVEEFLSNNSEVASIYQKLQVDAEDPTLHRWGEEDLLRLIHLETRTSAQHGCFMATHHDNEAGVRHTQAERAAIIATTAIRHKQALDNDEVGHHEYKGVALCAYLEQDWLYNTSRVPGRDCDEMKRFPDRHHCVVLGNGRFFKLELVNGSGEPFSFGQIHNAFEYMAKEFQGDRASVMPGSLTVDNRDSWAEVRSSFKNFFISSNTDSGTEPRNIDEDIARKRAIL